ncbi:MAG: tRNA uridine-5-carboxymethylaminomethyl(34) synthesis GTPase MnmE, partial [Halanaerobiales bacterium]
MISEDTIAAIATPYGTGGIGKIRISGPRALDIADNLFQKSSGNISLKNVDTHTVHHGFIIDPETGKKVDEIVAIIMNEPNSFTGENVVEFDCHGGMVPLQRVLGLTLNNGARMAEPGEFSKRAFLNGKIDLAQAEGIIEIINSKTEKSLDIAVDHLTGKLSDKVNSIRDQILSLLAHLEASIDFPEDEIEGYNFDELGKRIKKIKNDIKDLLETSRQGKIYQEGISTAIVGKPNVGKSSLMNYFLEEKRAIVTEIPGTTRDIIEEYINLKGVPLKIIDTAGIRETEDKVEKIGVEKTRESLKNADLILLMLDVSDGISSEDLAVYDLVKDKSVIIILNKTDLPERIAQEKIEQYFPDHPRLWVSLKEEKGLDKLKDEILREILQKEINPDQDIFITRVRHKNALEQALEAINRVKQAYDNNTPNDFLTIDLKECLDKIGEI